MLSLLLAAFLGAPVENQALQTGVQLTFKGQVAQPGEGEEPGEAKKVFELVLTVAESGDDGGRLFWQVSENGRGRWPWPERFGQLDLDQNLQASGTEPSLLYDRGEGTSVIPITLPLLKAGQPLKKGLTWKRGDWRYEVTRQAKHNDRATWRIEVSNNYGPQKLLWAAKEGPLVVGLRQRVFMGMGEEYAVTMELKEVQKLTGVSRESALKGFPALLDLRDKLGRKPRTEAAELTAKQLAVLQQGLPELQLAAADGKIVELVKAVRRDLAVQSDRAGALEKLAAQRVGKPAPKFKLDGLGSARLTNDDLKDHVTVLHFWEYRDSPLNQPYGQVGYLDFLYQKRKGDGVQVYGVASDYRLREATTIDEATRSVKKLQKFMNLDYPILLDDGRLLKHFGDPRLLGAKLPLFVVIGPDGNVAHYKVGHYEVDRLLGLKELNDAVGKLLK